MKFHKLPHLTRDVTGQHYRSMLSPETSREEEVAEIQPSLMLVYNAP